MLLAIDVAAIAIFRFVQSILLGFGDVTIVLGFINRLALRNVRVVFLVSGRLPPIHGPVRKALVYARLLIIEALIDLVLAGMIRHRCGLRHRLNGDERGA
jgi:hypothetical protein